jgi:hypothetical protein
MRFVDTFRLGGLSSLGVVLVAGGCTLIFPSGNEQCESAADCADRGFTNAACVDNLCVASDGGGGSGVGGMGTGGNSKWGCIGTVEWDAATTEPLNIHANLARLIGEQPVANAPAKVCAPLDVDCEMPLSEGVSDEDGKLVVEAHYGFRGYTLISPPPDYPEMAPAIMWSNPPLFEENPDPNVAHLTSTGEVASAAAIVGADVDPAMGHLFGLTVDCMGQLTSGVVIKAGTVGPETTAYYIKGSLPSPTATETDPNGQAGYVNLPPGNVTITATSTEAGKYAEVTILIKAGHVTYLALPPTPL